MTVVVLLALLTITLALSYAMLRTQVSTVQLEGNRSRMAEARQAALSGLSAALRKMHESSWSGVNTTYAGQLNSEQWFEVTYTTGDPALSPTHPDYALLPWRVTLNSTGYAIDAAYPQMRSTHKVQAVVQLVPRQLAAEPSGWDSTQPYTVYQWKPNINQQFVVEVPCRLEGKIRIQGRLSLCEDYPEDYLATHELFKDWNQMRLNGHPDYRPFNEAVHFTYLLNSSQTRSLLNGQLSVTTVNVFPQLIPTWERPAAGSTYQLYPGGQYYSIPALPPRLRDITLAPDPLVNPAGLFHRLGPLDIERNVVLRGTVLVGRSSSQDGDLAINGSSVKLEPYDLPALEGTAQPVQLPALVVQNDLEIDGDTQAELRGLVAVEGRFAVEQGGQTQTRFDLQGRLLAQDIVVAGRNEWDQSESWWENRLDDFRDDLALPNPITYFPQWLEQRRGLQNASRTTIKPDPAAPRYHWKDAASPLYVPHPDDPGLRWNLVRWTSGK